MNEVKETLASPDIMVTNQSDKDGQLHKVGALHEEAGQAWQTYELSERTTLGEPSYAPSLSSKRHSSAPPLP